MCGIAGVVRFDGAPVPAEAVRAMTTALAHRGPDGEGFLEVGPVSLGHTRLAILDLSPAGRQPMRDSSGRFAIVFNGEIYNFVELRAELEREGTRFRSGTDTEVLLEGYARWGPSVLGRLNGMFAFALWDSVERVLFCARDRFGEKPFFHRHLPGREFRFASEIKALVPPGGGEGRPREEALFRFLALGHAGTTTDSFFEGIDQVPPAHSLTLRDGKIEVRRYWGLPEEPSRTEEGEEESVARVAALLEDAVRLRLRSDVPVGTSLSGGLDSSAVVGFVARLLRAGQGGGAGTRQAAFSACLPGSEVDETRWVEEVARFAGVESRRVVPTGEGFLADLTRLVAAQEEPIGGPSVYAQWKVMELARSSGVVVLLDGQGADEVFAGYHFLFQDHWWSLLRGGRVGALRAEMSAYDAVHGKGGARRLLRAALRSRSPRWLSRMKGGPSVPWISGDFVARAAVPPPDRPSDLRGSLRESRTTRMLPHLLRYADRNSMAFSREVRLPFLDHRLVEAADALPPDRLLRGAVTKWIQREAIRGVVPESIRTRADKIGFAVPTDAWLRGPCAEALREDLLSARARGRGIFEVPWIEGALRRFRAGDDGPSAALWNCWAAERWMRVFVDGPGGR